MPIEIERKFLVKNLNFIRDSSNKKSIEQGYLSKDPNRTVRVRIEDEKAFITIKGKSFNNGTSRIEVENKISLKDARELMSLCLSSPIKKIRYLISINNFIFEVDVFQNNNNKGLIIAEIELDSENSKFPKPDWLGEEVTGQIKFYNSQL
ncbi:MAG: CYTH domain-containing protein [Flavobacteriaceae bacterium]|nr:CYTH domain-containing protein [Flavobacteriaceae bacterium]